MYIKNNTPPRIGILIKPTNECIISYNIEVFNKFRIIIL